MRRNSYPADFSWAKDFGFIPPKSGGEVSQRKSISFAASQENDLKTLLDELLKTLLIAVNADAAIIRIVPPHGQALRSISSVGLPAEMTDGKNVFESPCEICEGATINQNIHSANIGPCGTNGKCKYAGSRFKSILVAPLITDNPMGRPIGKLVLLFNDSQQPNDTISTTLLPFACLIASILKRNKAKRDAKRAVLLAERQAIANEIHDSLAQTLAYARMRTSLLLESIRSGNEVMSAKYAHDIDDALEINQKTVRELITDFRCSMDPSGLLHALQTLAEQFRDRNEIELEYINRVAHLELPLEYEIQAFHIVQEALSNIATHSGATHARLTVDSSDNYYILTIEDNGSGGCTFTPVEGHYGMMIMRERAQRIGGEIKVESSEGLGTHVQLFFPEPGADWRIVNE